jgi:hypothetical protein
VPGHRVTGIFLLTALLLSCSESQVVIVPDDRLPDAGVARTSESYIQGQTSVDLLFVIDNTAGMAQVQSAVADDIGTLIARLELAKLDWRIGVISSDLGIDPFTGPGCSKAGGDGAELQNIPRQPGCKPPPDRFITAKNVADPEAAFRCIALLGEQGCGFERPMEAALRAVDPGSLPAGNKTFLRDTALLMVIWISNEDDCSAQDPRLYDPDLVALGVWSSYRCFDQDIKCTGKAGDGSLAGCASGKGSYLRPVSEVAKKLRALKPAGDVVVVAVVGPRTPVRAQEGNDPKVLPSCSGAKVQARPAIRFHELVAEFGADGAAVSVCAPELGKRIAEAAGALRTSAGPYCFRNPFSSPGRPACSVEAVLPDGTRISVPPSAPGSPGFRIIHPLVPGCRHGALDFDDGARPPAGAEVFVTCSFVKGEA